MRKHNLAFVDLETTGFDPERHEIIEIGCVLARQTAVPGRGARLELIEEFELKVKLENLSQADPEALRINGYNETEWLFAWDLISAMKIFVEKTKETILVAHNLTFEWSFLEEAFYKTGLKNKMHYSKIDTISFALGRLYHESEATKFSLGALADYLGIKQERAHTALADARTTFAVYQKLIEK